MKLKTPSSRCAGWEAQGLVKKLVANRLGDCQLPFSLRLKYFCEQVVAGIGLVVLAVPMLAIYLLVKISSPGGGLFKQSRVGLGGITFTMYKFRTMSLDAERKSGPVWSPGGNDPRLTTLGKLLRFLYLDELPQLWNVVKGEMSLIGPRPERPVFVLMLAEEVDDYLARLQVRPGITGLAQVYLDADVTIDCVRKKILFDKFYIKRQSVLLDLRIAFCTVVRMMGFRHGRPPRWSGLTNYLIKTGFFRSSASNAVAASLPGQTANSGFQFDSNLGRPLSVQAMSFSNGSNSSYLLDETVSTAVRKPK